MPARAARRGLFELHLWDNGNRHRGIELELAERLGGLARACPR